MADTPDLETLKRKGRRRLVGAIALVLVAVIVLPMVFDSEPKRPPPVSVRIPNEDDPAFTPKVVPKGPPVEAPKAAAPKPEASAPKPEAQAPKPDPAVPKPEATAPKPEVSKPEPSSAKAEPAAPAADSKAVDAKKAAEAERRRAQAALAGGEQYIVPVGAFASDEKVQELVASFRGAGLPSYTEPLATAKGKVTRVRVGPFGSQAEADKAAEKLLAMGLKPGKVAKRP